MEKVIKLRPYQEQALEKIKWGLTLDGNDIVMLPTGAGKSIVIAELARHINQDILILQPTKEILEQNKRKLSLYVDENEIGVYSASLNEKVIKKYTFATIGSVYKVPHLFNHFKTVLIDECHLLNPKDTGSMFGSFLKAIGVKKVIGFTATPYRIFPTYFVADDNYENRGWGANNLVCTNSIKVLTRVTPFFWNRIIFCINPHELTEQGYLCPLAYVDKTTIEQELIPLNKSRTDFDYEAYDKMVSARDRDVVALIQEANLKHKSLLVFCNSVSQAKRLTFYFPNSASVSSQSSVKERDEVINGFKDGKYKIVFNVGVLTTGFDMPELDCIVMLRPTRSVALYYQMLGRGVRISPGKEKCTVYDWSGNLKAIGEVDSIKLTKVDGKWDLVSGQRPLGWHGVELYRFVVKELRNKPTLFSQ